MPERKFIVTVQVGNGACESREIDVVGVETKCPGIAVTPYCAHDGDTLLIRPDRYVLTHLASGRKMSERFTTLFEAKLVAAAIGGLGVDFSKSRPVVVAAVRMLPPRILDWYQSVTRTKVVRA